MLLFMSLIAATPAAATPAVQEEKKVCRSLPQAGSIMRKRECHTRQEWEEIDARNRANAERYSQTQDRPY